MSYNDLAVTLAGLEAVAKICRRALLRGNADDYTQAFGQSADCCHRRLTSAILTDDTVQLTIATVQADRLLTLINRY
jgi:hypothetical protein